MTQKIIVGLILVGIIAAYGLILVGTVQAHDSISGLDNVNDVQYTHRGPIRINGNNNFTAANGVSGGNGTPENPYIISGYYIDAQGTGDAIYVGNVTAHFIIENCYLINAVYTGEYHDGDGVYLYNTTNGTITNNIITNPENAQFQENGISLKKSNNNTIKNNTIYNVPYGIYLYSSFNNTLAENNLSDDFDGIFSTNSAYNIIYGNYLYNNSDVGIGLIHSSYNVLYENSFNLSGLGLVGSEDTFTTQIIYTNNTVNGKPIYYIKNSKNIALSGSAGELILGNVSEIDINNVSAVNSILEVEIGYSSNITVENSSFSQGQMSIFVINSTSIKILNNTIANQTEYSVYLENSQNVLVCDNNISKSKGYYEEGGAIQLSSSTNNTISGNTISQSAWGIFTSENSGNNTISNNILKNDTGGIFISSTNNTLYGNSLYNDGIFFDSQKNIFVYQNITTTNTVNGKPVYYFKNMNLNNTTIPGDAGEIILGNVSWATVSNVNITNATVGVLAGYSSHITIKDSTISENSHSAIYFVNTYNSTIENCTMNANWQNPAIYFKNSNNNIIINSTISNTKGSGIYLDSANSNQIIHNLISNNTDRGVAIFWGSYNRIYNNSFYYNDGSGDHYSSAHIQAFAQSYGENYWNSTSGYGNYWRDWADNNNTNDQNHDGIVDEPYTIAGFSQEQDYYPLKNATYPMPALAPTAPRNLNVTVGADFVNLTWSAPLGNGSSEITEYKIYRNGTLIATVPATQLYYNDTTVVPGQSYAYYVVAVNEVGSSVKSNVIQATPTPAVPEFSVVFLAIGLLALIAIVRRVKL